MPSIMSRLPHMSRILFWSIAKHVRICQVLCLEFYFKILLNMLEFYFEALLNKLEFYFEILLNMLEYANYYV
jgi:hypothetical protein